MQMKYPMKVLKVIVASFYFHSHGSFRRSEMLLGFLIKTTLISTVLSVRLEPGQPGGPWTEEEISIVREKVKGLPLSV